MIANATSSVDVAKTVGEIMGILSKLGARAVTIRYDDSNAPSGVGFDLLMGDDQARSFELPVQVDGVYAALRRDAGPKYRNRDQAVRTAWRIAKDWLRMQAALIDARMVVVDEVMLPWMLVPGEGENDPPRTVHAAYRAQATRALPGGSS